MTHKYDQMLDRLMGLLRVSPLTARAIAKALSCSRPVAYERLQALREREGTRAFYTVQVRESLTGPQATAYGLRFDL